MADLTSKEERVLRKLANETPGQWVPRRRLHVASSLMEDLYFRGLVKGAGSQDHRGWGMTPDTSWWRITDEGLVAIGRRQLEAHHG